MSLILENAELRVELRHDRPVPERYVHKRTGMSFGGGGTGTLGVDGERYGWERWTCRLEAGPDAVRYRMSLPELPFSVTFDLRLGSNALELRIVEWEEPAGEGRRLSWHDLPLLTSSDPSLRFWRLVTSAPDLQSFGKMWAREQRGEVGASEPEVEPREVVHGALWNDRLCVSVESSYPLFPTLHRLSRSGYEISLNAFRRRVRSKELPLLEAQVVFLDDTNGDGKADLSDYRLWLSRSLPDGDPLYARTIWYKILMDGAAIGVKTTFPQVEEIARAIHNVTDGLPQLAYLVGCQEGGHDGSYPTLASFNTRLGTPQDLRRLAERCRRSWNTLLSFHVNLDDAYRASRDWDERIVVAANDQECYGVQGSVCHTADAESGSVFRRLAAMLEMFPVRETLHFDNTRITNTVSGGPSGVGMLQELVCGLEPVMAWLRHRGITVTTEGLNGLPAEPTRLFSGFWHHDIPDGARQIYHRKIMGGGRGDHFARSSALDFGICNAIHHDFSYAPISRTSMGEAWWARHAAWMSQNGDVPLSLSLAEDFPRMVDWIYRGTLLYQFYLEREMLSWEDEGGGVRMRFADGVTAEVGTETADSLRVAWGDVLVAEGDDRFIPRDGVVYAYSRGGCGREWTLPPSLRGRRLEAFALGKGGRLKAAFDVTGERIRLMLEPGVPVKILPA